MEKRTKRESISSQMTQQDDKITPPNDAHNSADNSVHDDTGVENTPASPAQPSASGQGREDDGMNARLQRLGGEPAPVITPEEFARLQKAGQVHIDSRGRVRTERPRGVDPGVSLRKRRAWYSVQA